MAEYLAFQRDPEGRRMGSSAAATTGSKLAAAATDASRAFPCETLRAAVQRAMTRMRSHDVLLLSPGCASWDQFDNYERRGEAFAEAIRSSDCAVKYRRHTARCSVNSRMRRLTRFARYREAASGRCTNAQSFKPQAFKPSLLIPQLFEIFFFESEVVAYLVQ